MTSWQETGHRPVPQRYFIPAPDPGALPLRDLWTSRRHHLRRLQLPRFGLGHLTALRLLRRIAGNFGPSLIKENECGILRIHRHDIYIYIDMMIYMFIYIYMINDTWYNGASTILGRRHPSGSLLNPLRLGHPKHTSGCTRHGSSTKKHGMVDIFDSFCMYVCMYVCM